MLTAEQTTLWNEYVAAEGDRIRYVFLPALDRFLTSVTDTPVEIWRDWAYGIAQKHLDQEDPFPIRFRLFTEAIFPALLQELRRGERDCARWLSGFTSLIFHRKECQAALADEGWSRKALLRLALEQHPEDVLARGQLIEEIADDLDYTLHELPTGVLYDQHYAEDGAR